MNCYYVLFSDFKKVVPLLACLLFGSLPSRATLTCPPNKSLVAPPFECSALLDFGSLVWSSTVPLTDTVFSPGPGYLFPIGTTAVALTVTELGGNTVSCAFTVSVAEYTQLLVCNDNIPVHLDSSCTRTITYDMILEGAWGCSSFYSTHIITPQGGLINPAVVDISYLGNGPHTVKVTNTVTGQNCWGSIVVAPYSIPFSIKCPADTIVNCNQNFDPTTTGEAVFTSCLQPYMVTLNYIDSYIDHLCNSGFVHEINRHWKVTDSYGNERFCVQNIKARRSTLSDVIMPHNQVISCLNVANDPMQIEPINMGEPTIFGAPIGTVCDLSIDQADMIIPICDGSYKILRQWTVIDWCVTEVVQYVQEIQVLDTIAPSVSLPDTIFISTNQVCGLEANFPAADVSDGCSGYSVIMTTPWDTISNNGGLLAVANIVGSYMGNYMVSDNCGNITETPVLIQVQQGTVVSCPPNLAITCDYYHSNLESALAAGNYAPLAALGEMQHYANCLVTPTQTVVVNVNDCGAGTILRTLGSEELTDQCTQTITVEHASDFVVEFPADTTINCGSIPFEIPDVQVFGMSCEHVNTTYSDAINNIVPDACYIIVRTWVVQNTCISTGNDTEPDTAESQLAPLSCDLNGDGECNARTIKAGSDGYITYQQVIKVTDNVDPVFVNGCAIPNICLDSCGAIAPIVLPVPETSDCSETFITAQIQIAGVWIDGFQPLNPLPEGDYIVRYVVVDHCNNQTQCLTNFKVSDCTAPIPICKNHITLELGANGYADLYAMDLDSASIDNCDPTPTFSFSESATFDYKAFNCTQLGSQTLELWVTDNSDNNSTCQTIVNVVSNVDCSTTLYDGNISTEEGLGVEGVQVYFFSDYDLTNSQGDYQVHAYGFQINTDVSPYYDEDHKNGVSTFDIVLVRRHVLGIQPLSSPYKMIAADVNGSMSITTFDLVVMQKMVLGNLNEFPNMTSWRFVPTNYAFSNPANPFTDFLTEQIWAMFPTLPGDLDFIAIKIGDVNGSASPNLSQTSQEAKAKATRH
jgi:hypothetical protein